MKIKTRISLAITFVILIPVWFCLLLAFSGIFDSLSRDRLVKRAATEFYESMRKENLKDFNLSKVLGRSLKADLVMYNNDNIVVYSSLPDFKVDVQISEGAVRELVKIMHHRTLFFTSVSEIENSNTHLLKNIPGFGKYNLNCAVIWETGGFLNLHSRFRIVIATLLFILLAVGLVVSIATLVFLGKTHVALKRISEKYAEGDYSKEIPETDGKNGEPSIITVLMFPGCACHAPVLHRVSSYVPSVAFVVREERLCGEVVAFADDVGLHLIDSRLYEFHDFLFIFFFF